MVVYVILILYSAFSLAPFLYGIISSFKTYAQVLTPTIIPHPAILANYQEIFSGNSYFGHYVLNSLIYAVGSTVLNMIFASMAGYAFGRMRFPGQNVLYALTLAVLIIPPTLIMVPKFLVANSLGMVDTYWALIVPAMATPTAVLIMTQLLKTLPRELEESAMIDGAGRLRTFAQIIMPLMGPGLTIVGILTFQGAWNDFLWPLLVMSRQSHYTLTVGLAFFKGAHYTEFNLLLAGATVNIVPLVALFFIFQRYFVQGVSTSGLAGR